MIRAVCLGFVLLSVGCSERAAPAPAEATKKLEPLPLNPAFARLPLGDRLGMEASARPAQAVRAEQLAAALTTRGITFSRTRQVLASPLGAAYCAMSVTQDNVGVSVCEFSDAASASIGLQRSRDLFDTLVPGRSLVTNHNTLLTVTHPETDSARRQSELILSVFAAQNQTGQATQTADTAGQGEQT